MLVLTLITLALTLLAMALAVSLMACKVNLAAAARAGNPPRSVSEVDKLWRDAFAAEGYGLTVTSVPVADAVRHAIRLAQVDGREKANKALAVEAAEVERRRWSVAMQGAAYPNATYVENLTAERAAELIRQTVGSTEKRPAAVVGAEVERKRWVAAFQAARPRNLFSDDATADRVGGYLTNLIAGERRDAALQMREAAGRSARMKTFSANTPLAYQELRKVVDLIGHAVATTRTADADVDSTNPLDR